jgi:predicted metalloendopeptidase
LSRSGFGISRTPVPNLKASSSSGRLFLSRWKECVHLTAEGLKRAAAVVYIRDRIEHVQQVSRHVRDMVDQIQKAFEQIVDAQDWLHKNSIREAIKERARSIRSKIAVPPRLLQTADEQLADLRIQVQDVFVSNIISMLRHEMLSELRRLNETPDMERDWLMEPLVPNAYYDSLNHFISKFNK